MRIWTIDAFTDRPFAGNPAGVCLLDAGAWPGEGALRWFTPGAESNVCGHATLATAHALRTDGGAPMTVRFASQFGVLIARSHGDGAITLDFPRLHGPRPVTSRNGIRGVIVTAAAAGGHGSYDFVSRFLAADGEDAVTGSAHTALAPYWAERLGRDKLTGFQASERTGLVHTAVQGDRVHLAGRAVTILHATLDPGAS